MLEHFNSVQSKWTWSRLSFGWHLLHLCPFFLRDLVLLCHDTLLFKDSPMLPSKFTRFTALWRNSCFKSIKCFRFEAKIISKKQATSKVQTIEFCRGDQHRSRELEIDRDHKKLRWRWECKLQQWTWFTLNLNCHIFLENTWFETVSMRLRASDRALVLPQLTLIRFHLALWGCQKLFGCRWRWWKRTWLVRHSPSWYLSKASSCRVWCFRSPRSRSTSHYMVFTTPWHPHSLPLYRNQAIISDSQFLWTRCASAWLYATGRLAFDEEGGSAYFLVGWLFYNLSWKQFERIGIPTSEFIGEINVVD